jgi:hypothetical protein
MSQDHERRAADRVIEDWIEERGELAVCVKGGGAEGLDRLLEVVRTRPLGAASYVQERFVATRTGARGDSVLFATGDGYEIVLSDWRRRPDDSRPKP